MTDTHRLHALGSIVIAEYDPQWPVIFEQERALLAQALGEMAVAIEHVGSTSVPGLAAKAIVDIMVGVRGEEDLETCIEPVRALGYEYVQRYEADMPFRKFFFKKPPASPQAVNLHIVPIDHPFWTDHILFRDFLRANPDVAKQYEQLKRDLAPQFTNSNQYSDAKTPFIREVEARARRETKTAD